MKTEIILVAKGSIAVEVVFHPDNIIDGYIESHGWIEVLGFSWASPIGELTEKDFNQDSLGQINAHLADLVNVAQYA